MADQLGQNYCKYSIEVNYVADKRMSDFKLPVEIETYFYILELDFICVTDRVVITGTKYKIGYFI